MRTIILVFVGLLCALILPFSEGSTIGLKSNRKFRQSTNSASNSLSVPQCGMSNVEVDRIVGGTEAVAGEFPWMTRLGYIFGFIDGEQMMSWMCGGTLISPRHILTAAHCFSEIPDFLLGYIARIGDVDCNSDNDGADPVDVFIEEIIIHDEYNDLTHENDVAVLKTDRKISFTTKRLPACLPPGNLKNQNLEGMETFIAGWGTTKYQGTSSDKLLKATVFITKQKECKDAYSKDYYAVIDNRTVCARNDGIDSCQGDSGGPLMLQNGNTTVVGIVSWGKGCASKNYPGVYTDVSSFLSFIKEAMTL
ncbi:PREDICTED: venom protease [Trachymyrmex cornetzi]|uniref:venom protease n=1 Tax=Trachymyrmex cornetzi TaxID=471704 RepID=UPI00084F3ADE|nr:PREDICTED: venom protease [Trachymyrmex cornetzi]